MNVIKTVQMLFKIKMTRCAHCAQLCSYLYVHILNVRFCFFLSQCFSSRRFLSDLKAWRDHSEIYDPWMKNAISSRLQTDLDASARHNGNALRDKSMPDRLTWMSECEKNMLHRVNNARFFVNKRNTVSFDNGVQFVGPIKKSDKFVSVSGEEVERKMAEEVYTTQRINSQKTDYFTRNFTF